MRHAHQEVLFTGSCGTVLETFLLTNVSQTVFFGIFASLEVAGGFGAEGPQTKYKNNINVSNQANISWGLSGQATQASATQALKPVLSTLDYLY